MKRFQKLHLLLKLMMAIVLLAVLGFSYVSYKKYELKTAVEEYLYEDLGLSKDEVIKVEPNATNLSGEKFWLAYVKLKGDEKTFIYYKDKNDQVVLESYMYKGLVYGP